MPFCHGLERLPFPLGAAPVRLQARAMPGLLLPLAAICPRRAWLRRHTERSGTERGPARAAQQPGLHTAFPGLAYFDSRGRSFFLNYS